MALKVSLYMGLSVDGFVARADDGLDFLGASGGGDAGVAQRSFTAFLATVDVIVMGRRTFEVVHRFGPEGWAYGETPMVVLSRGWTALPPGTRPTVRLGQGEPAAVLAELEASGVRHVYVDGASTAQRFLAAGLLTDLVVTYVPVLIGSGISAWGALPRDVPVELVGHEVLGGAAMQLHYRVR
ncbi:MAG: dihydrofolate reductase family protein [Myxococcota bacterium]